MRGRDQKRFCYQQIDADSQKAQKPSKLTEVKSCQSTASSGWVKVPVKVKFMTEKDVLSIYNQSVMEDDTDELYQLVRELEKSF